MYVSPYQGLAPDEWPEKTQQLLDEYPLSGDQIVKPILEAWDSIFESKIGKYSIQIGKDIFPTPQIMASYLHELIPVEFAALYRGQWRGDKSPDEKDLVYIPDDHYSAEIKTSSAPKKIYANRSYAQKPTSFKKNKNGYYIAVNFEKFDKKKTGVQRPRIRRIRFGDDVPSPVESFAGGLGFIGR